MTAGPRGDDAGQRTLTLAQARAFAADQVRGLVERAAGRTATYTDQGAWVLDSDGWAPTWTGGFLAGQLWILSEWFGGGWWAEQARAYTRLLEPRKDDRGTHDIGFLLEPSFGRWFAAEHDPHAREVIVAGGRTMAARLQPAGGYLCTWVDPGSTFVDVMMNVGIIFRAAQYADDAALAAVARRHVETTRRYLVRGDGSTAHEGWFNVETGEFLRTATHQGWRSDSSWARGQAWAIYGFAESFRYSGERAFLATARAAADYYIAHTDASGIPPNDWLDPHPARPWEASAACIAASAMLDLADRCAEAGDDGAAARYREYGVRIVASLCSTRFLAVDTPGWQGIIRHATYHGGNGIGVDESVMWGDYYFVEALHRLWLAERDADQGAGVSRP